MKSSKIPQNRTTNERLDIEPLMKFNQNNEIINIQNTHERIIGSDPFIFDIVSKVLNRVHIHFEDEYDEKLISVNHYTMVEFVYFVIKSSMELIQESEVNTVHDLTKFDLKVFSLFFTPSDITEEELNWVDRYTDLEDVQSNILTMEIPLEYKKNYLVNIKRILDRNRDNFTFNDSVLEYLLGSEN